MHDDAATAEIFPGTRCLLDIAPLSLPATGAEYRDVIVDDVLANKGQRLWIGRADDQSAVAVSVPFGHYAMRNELILRNAGRFAGYGNGQILEFTRALVGGLANDEDPFVFISQKGFEGVHAVV